MPAIAPATIAGLAKLAGIDVESLHAYDRMGLLPKPHRAPGASGRTAYQKDHLERLVFIQRALEFGFSLEAVGELLGVRGGLRTCSDNYRVTDRQLAEVRNAAIGGPADAAEVRRKEKALGALLAACRGVGSAGSCAILAELSRKRTTIKLAFDPRHLVLKAEVEGVFGSQDMADLDAAVSSFLGREDEATGSRVRGLYDFSAVEAVAVPATRMAERGRRLSIVREQRVMVMPRQASGSFGQGFCDDQRTAGNGELRVVRSLEDAFAFLGVRDLRFEPVPL